MKSKANPIANPKDNSITNTYRKPSAKPIGTQQQHIQNQNNKSQANPIANRKLTYIANPNGKP